MSPCRRISRVWPHTWLSASNHAWSRYWPQARSFCKSSLPRMPKPSRTKTWLSKSQICKLTWHWARRNLPHSKPIRQWIMCVASYNARSKSLPSCICALRIGLSPTTWLSRSTLMRASWPSLLTRTTHACAITVGRILRAWSNVRSIKSLLKIKLLWASP